MVKTTAALAVILAALGPFQVTSETACSYIESAPAIEYSLPASTSSGDLSIKFVGVTPVVTRKQLPVGAVPKMTIVQYSSEPNIDYDDATGSLVISSTTCGTGPSAAGTSGAQSVHPKKGLLSVLACTLALANKQARPYALSLAVLGAAMTTMPTVNARRLHEDECTESMEVVLEAPASYMGATETCLAEVTDKTQCPTPFPTFKTDSDPSPVCPVVVIGAGTGGLYTALR